MGKHRSRFVPFITPLVLASGEHKDATLVERHRLDVSEIPKATGLRELMETWIRGNLIEGEGIRYRDHSLKYRLDRYSEGRSVFRNNQWRCVDRLADDDLACIRDITPWFKKGPSYAIVEVGFNRSLEICKVAINVALPTGNTLFLAVGVDRGLKTFYVNDKPKVPGLDGFRCTVEGCEYATASQLYLA